MRPATPALNAPVAIGSSTPDLACGKSASAWAPSRDVSASAAVGQTCWGLGVGSRVGPACAPSLACVTVTFSVSAGAPPPSGARWGAPCNACGGLGTGAAGGRNAAPSRAMGATSVAIGPPAATSVGTGAGAGQVAGSTGGSTASVASPGNGSAAIGPAVPACNGRISGAPGAPVGCTSGLDKSSGAPHLASVLRAATAPAPPLAARGNRG